MSELQQLRDRVAELEDVLGMTAAPALKAVLKPKGFWLKTCEPFCGLLLKRSVVSREAAFIAIYGLRPECDQPNLKLLDVTILRLRQALEPYGIRVEMVRNVGWYMTAENKAKLRALIEAPT